MFDLFDTSRTFTGHEIDFEGERWMLLLEVKNDCYFAVKSSDPHPRQVYFIHITWEEGEKEQVEQGIQDALFAGLRQRFAARAREGKQNGS